MDAGAVVRRLYEHLAARDADNLRALVHPEVEWDLSERLFDAQVLHGRPAVERYFEEWFGISGEGGHVVDELVVRGEQVVAAVRLKMRGRQSGIPVEAAVSHVWTVRGGMVVRFKLFQTWEEALAAAGIEDG